MNAFEITAIIEKERTSLNNGEKVKSYFYINKDILNYKNISYLN